MFMLMIVSIFCVHEAYSLDAGKISRWRQSSSKALPLTPRMTARSKFECAALCLRNVRCFRFCHNPSTMACFLDQSVTSAKGQVAADDTVCYDNVQTLAGGRERATRGDRASVVQTENCLAYDNYDLYGGRCLQLNATLVSYKEAKDQCAREGGHLFYYKTLANDERPLADLLVDRANIYMYSWVWIGGDAIGTNRSFSWNDGTPLPVPPLSDLWYPGEPNNINGDEDCVCFRDLRLNDISCDDEYQFVCEIDL